MALNEERNYTNLYTHYRTHSLARDVIKVSTSWVDYFMKLWKSTPESTQHKGTIRYTPEIT